MVIGIGFLTMLIGLIAQQFAQPDVKRLEADVRDVGDLDEEVRAELREIAARLQTLERRLSA